jgi:hypothetical protein
MCRRYHGAAGVPALAIGTQRPEQRAGEARRGLRVGRKLEQKKQQPLQLWADRLGVSICVGANLATRAGGTQTIWVRVCEPLEQKKGR